MRMNTIIEELDRSSKTIAPEKLQEVIKKIKEHKRIFVYGTGRSGLMLKAFAMRLMLSARQQRHLFRRVTS